MVHFQPSVHFARKVAKFLVSTKDAVLRLKFSEGNPGFFSRLGTTSRSILGFGSLELQYKPDIEARSLVSTLTQAGLRARSSGSLAAAWGLWEGCGAWGPHGVVLAAGPLVLS